VLAEARAAMTVLRAHELRSVAAILAHAGVIEGLTA
jgi:hypothetical protein